MKNSGGDGLMGVNKPYRRVQEDKANLKAFLNCPALGVKERLAIKQMVNTLDDATLNTQTKIKHSQEIYSEMKAHKQYADDAEKTKIILQETQGIITEALATQILMPNIEPLAVGDAMENGKYETADEKKGWMSLYYELEGAYLC